MKSCKDCENYQKSDDFKWFPFFGWWWRKKNGDLFATCWSLYGVLQPGEETFCRVARASSHLCGPDAKMWRAKK